MNRILSIVLLICFALPGFSQDDTTFKQVRVIKGDITGFTVDNLDNVYILNSRNQLKKLNANGDSVAIYNDVKKFGQASLIDVTNPLKILLYYKDFATIVMLDRFLNVVNVVDLRKQGILQAKAIGQSNDNKIWVYDEAEAKLKKLDESGKLLLETPDIRLLTGQAAVPSRIFDENRYVYLYDPEKEVFVFDYFGTFKNGILISHWQNLKVAGKYIFGTKADSIYRYDINTTRYDEWTLPFPIQKSRSFNFTFSRVYALQGKCQDDLDCLYIYDIR